MSVSVEDLRMSIERRLEVLSEQAERLRCALDALGAPQAAPLSGDRDDTPQLTVNDPAPGAAEGQSTAPAVGADRALHDLRSELTAALRNGRN